MAVAAQQVTRAEELVRDGEKALKKFSFFDKTGKFEEAAEHFQNAGKAYLIGKAYTESGAILCRAADLYTKVKQDHEAANSYQKAAEAYEKVNEELAIKSYRDAIGIFVKGGKGAMAANASKKVAELYEASGNHSDAAENYSAAADLYEGEGRAQAANACKEKMAFLNADLGAFDVAAETFENLGRESLTSKLGKFSAKKFFTNGSLCLLARGDVVSARQKMQEFASLDYTFQDTREWTLCDQLCQAFEDYNEEAVGAACAEYDKIKRLDPWTTHVLLTIKRNIHAEAGAGEEEEVPPEASGHESPTVTPAGNDLEDDDLDLT